MHIFRIRMALRFHVCRVGLPSTVLWSIPGTYANQPVYGCDWALVAVLHVISSVFVAHLFVGQADGRQVKING